MTIMDDRPRAEEMTPDPLEELWEQPPATKVVATRLGPLTMPTEAEMQAVRIRAMQEIVERQFGQFLTPEQIRRTAFADGSYCYCSPSRTALFHGMSVPAVYAPPRRPPILWPLLFSLLSVAFAITALVL